MSINKGVCNHNKINNLYIQCKFTWRQPENYDRWMTPDSLICGQEIFACGLGRGQDISG